MHRLISGDPKGEKVLFLHGWGGDASAFLFCAERLKDEFCCVLPDFRGFGKSAEPKFPFGVADHAEDVLALADEAGAERFCLVGHSFGGRVAIEIAARHPERVRSLVLVDSAGLRPRRGVFYRLRVFTHKLLKKLGGKGLAGSSDYRALSPVMKGTFVKVVNYDQTFLLPRIVCPTAVFWGKGDRDTPLYMAKRFVRGIRDSSLFLLEGGHFAYLEDER